MRALEKGVESAYKAVMKPTEGTILTVARVAAMRAREELHADTTTEEIWDVILEAGREALAETPELLPVLKKAGVVDAGGQGLIVVFEGMAEVFHGRPGVEPGEEKPADSDSIHPDRNAAGEYVGEITHTYCTEFLVKKTENSIDPQDLRAFLESIGDCVVVVDDDDIIKCHVHTDHPGQALEKAGANGAQLTSLKIENMQRAVRGAERRAIVEPESDAGLQIRGCRPVARIRLCCGRRGRRGAEALRATSASTTS